MLLDLYPIWKKVISFGSERVMWPARRALKRRGSTEKNLRTHVSCTGRAVLETTLPLHLNLTSQGLRRFDPERLSPETARKLDHARRAGDELIEFLLLVEEI